MARRVFEKEELTIRYAVLGSGSDGNAYVFETRHHLIIIDAGFTSQEITKRMQKLGFSLYKPMLLFCTHIHKDHMLGLEDLARFYNAMVITHQVVQERFNLLEGIDFWLIKPNAHYIFQEIAFQTFSTSHDAPHSLSYMIEIYGKRFMILTDTGVVSPAMRRHAFYSHVLFLESNYSEEILATGTYPDFLKKRISGNKGHLSNRQAAELLLSIQHTPYLQQLFLCHLSKDNNSLEHVECEVIDASGWDKAYHICPKGVMSRSYTFYI